MSMKKIVMAAATFAFSCVAYALPTVADVVTQLRCRVDIW